jgi:beta-ureidopropionase / N-carbamoyl-L-amino-acid hydrolase
MKPLVNRERLWNTFMEIGHIGETEAGGCHRLALSDEDRRARLLLVEWAREAGCTITVDEVGNIFARRRGERDDARPVMMGSHLDTVPMGGKFDGVFGVMAGLEVLRTLNDAGTKTEYPIELVNWTNEEGSRFSPATLGSQTFCQLLDREFTMTRTDAAGTTFREALAATGFAGTEKIGTHAIGPYIEVHVEQGPVLEDTGHEIGIVPGCYAARYYVATIKGEAGHVGPAPMDRRRDALVGAARVILEVNRVGCSHGAEGRSNAPHIEVFPNVRGVIPGEARVSCDIRNVDQEALERMERDLMDALADLSQDLGMEIELEPYFQFGPISFDRELTALCRDVTETLGYSHREVHAIAGHDAISLNNVTPAALVLVPSRGGVSHCQEEFATAEDLEKGANVLLHAVLAKAGVVTAT